MAEDLWESGRPSFPVRAWGQPGVEGLRCPGQLERVQGLAQCGAEPALSADAAAMVPGDMFSQMRVAFACGRGA
ncbi:MAG: hypothetical protein ACRDRX_02505 [Pseudonocardiaceae bacterium]